jgi:drug/metabolite transporter (DMT)-like permease
MNAGVQELLPWIALYMGCSASMLLVNKVVTRAFTTALVVSVVEAQLLFAVMVLTTLFRSTLRFGSSADVARWATRVPPLYAGMLATSMLGLGLTPVGLTVVLRNVAPLITLPFEPAAADCWTWLSLLVTLGGVLVYVRSMVEERASSSLGIGLVVVNLFISVALRQAERRLVGVQPVDLSKTAVLLLNNACGAVLLSPLLLMRGEHREWSAALDVQGAAAWAWLLLSCVVGVAIGWSAISVQQRVSATTMFVIINTNKVLVIAVGMLLLGDPASPLAVVGTALALSGGAAYGLAWMVKDKKKV